MSIFLKKILSCLSSEGNEKTGPISFKRPSSPYRQRKKEKNLFSAEQMVTSHWLDCEPPCSISSPDTLTGSYECVCSMDLF